MAGLSEISIKKLYGVGEVRARIMSASQPQVRLVRNFGAELLEQTLMFPSLEL